MNDWAIVLTTAASETEAEAIAQALIEAKLAACVNLFPIKSVYIWEGNTELEQEWQLTIKTRMTQFEAIASKIQSLHSYDVPELIALPIEKGSAAYLSWMNAQVPTEKLPSD